MDNKAVIEAFYAAFARRDAEAMARLYHRDLVFCDPVFGELARSEAVAMWTMLCARGKDLAIVLAQSNADQQQGSADWEATYTFSKTGKRVHNKVHAALEFRDGLIIKHTDTFDFWKWSAMALGLPGVLLGWSPLIKNAIRKEARRSLNAQLSRST